MVSIPQFETPSAGSKTDGIHKENRCIIHEFFFAVYIDIGLYGERFADAVKGIGFAVFPASLHLSKDCVVSIEKFSVTSCIPGPEFGIKHIGKTGVRLFISLCSNRVEGEVFLSQGFFCVVQKAAVSIFDKVNRCTVFRIPQGIPVGTRHFSELSYGIAVPSVKTKRVKSSVFLCKDIILPFGMQRIHKIKMPVSGGRVSHSEEEGPLSLRIPFFEEKLPLARRGRVSVCILKETVGTGINHIVSHIYHVFFFCGSNIASKCLMTDFPSGPVGPVGEIFRSHSFRERFVMKVMPVIVFNRIDVVTIHLLDELFRRNGRFIIAEIAVTRELNPGRGNVNGGCICGKFLPFFILYNHFYKISGIVLLRCDKTDFRIDKFIFLQNRFFFGNRDFVMK